MKIAVVGKGGSGKSTVASVLTFASVFQNQFTTAVDADYNLDLAYALGVDVESHPLLNHSEKEFYKFLGLAESERYIDIPQSIASEKFTVRPPDEFTKKYVVDASPYLQTMVVGGVHEEALYGDRCNHAYFAPLKYWLSYVEEGDEFVVVDSVAGTDMVSYGLYLGVDAVVVVVEPTRQSQHAADMIESICRQFEVDVIRVGNKITSEKPENIVAYLPIEMSLVTDPKSFAQSAKGQEFLKDVKDAVSEVRNNESGIKRMKLWTEKHDIQATGSVQGKRVT